MMIVDAHLHVWDPERITYPWLTTGPLRQRFGIDDVEPELKTAGVDRAVLVQAADSAEESAYLLMVADAHEVVAGVVGWMPLDRPDELERALRVRDPRIVGVRTLIHDRTDPDWIITDADAGLGMLAEAGLPYDFVTSGPDALVHLPRIAGRHPALRLVIDHLGKPPVHGSTQERARWRSLLRAAAEHPGTYAKASGLAPEGAQSPPAADALRPFIDDALDVFGADRLMIGSDWPIATRHGGYSRTWTALDECLRGLYPASRAAVLGGTARTFYGLDERKPS